MRPVLLGAVVLALGAALAGAAEVLSPREEHTLGRLEPQKAGRRAHFQAGIDAARALLATDPNDPEGLLWLAANLGDEALERGKFAALKVLPEMERLLLRLDVVDPAYDGAAASRVLGSLYSSAPSLISIGSGKKARAAFEKALALASQHPGNQALAAEFFYAKGPKQRALELARAVLQNPDLEKYPLDSSRWKQIAETIVRKSVGKMWSTPVPG